MQVFLSVEAFVPELRGLNRQEAGFFLFFLTPLRFGLLYVPAHDPPQPPFISNEIKGYYCSMPLQIAHTMISDIFISLKGPENVQDSQLKIKVCYL